MMPMSLARDVFDRWKTEGVVRDDVDELREGRALIALAALAQRRGFALPETFRALWQLSDGTAAMDGDEIMFWPLDNIAEDPSLGGTNGLVLAVWRLDTIYRVLVFEQGQPKHVSAVRY